MTADHSGANKHWMNQRNLMRASIRNHRVYLYIRNNHRYIIAQHMSKGRVALQVKTRRTSKHLTNAYGRKSLSFFSVGTFTLPKSLLDGRVRFKGTNLELKASNVHLRMHHCQNHWHRQMVHWKPVDAM